MNEEWKDIQGYEGLYQVSNLGRVKSLERSVVIGWGAKRLFKEKILKDSVNNKNGYVYVGLHKNGKTRSARVHRLVALEFLENRDNLPAVNHKNEIKTDNHVENLEWCDSKYNNNYGNHMKKIVENTDYAKRTLNTNYHTEAREKQLRGLIEKQKIPCYGIKDDKMIRFSSNAEAARYIGGQSAHVQEVLKGRRKTHKGWIFIYAEKEKNNE